MSSQAVPNLVASAPLAGWLQQSGGSIFRSRTYYKTSVIILTFLAYASFHMSRRPLSVVKGVLNQNCSSLVPPTGVDPSKDPYWCDWEPFGGDDGNGKLGTMDSIYLFTYALCMFFSGFLAERMDLRYFLSMGLILSGFTTYLFGLAFYFKIHSFWFFGSVQFMSGIVQSTGWACVVVIVANWFPKSTRGRIFGIWNAHTYLGNIVGAVVAGVFVETNWGLSFVVPGAMASAIGFSLFLFLIPSPTEVGLPIEADPIDEPVAQDPTERDPLLTQSDHHNYGDSNENPCSSITHHPHHEPHPQSQTKKEDEATQHNKKAVSLWRAFLIPGVLEYSFSLFFSKLVAYIFLYWLPNYIKYSTNFPADFAAYASVPFDVGGILGSVIAGFLADKTKASGLTCIGMLTLAIPSLYLYQLFGSHSLVTQIGLQILAGALVNGPYCLITTAVSADLGNSLKDSNAMATVTAIIDGTGSIGAALGPMVAGFVSNSSWDNVFYIVMLSDLIALLLLSRVGWKEIKIIRSRRSHVVL